MPPCRLSERRFPAAGVAELRNFQQAGGYFSDIPARMTSVPMESLMFSICFSWHDGCSIAQCRDTSAHETRRPQLGRHDYRDDRRVWHMVEHMQAGKDSMAMCPMMKQMGDTKHRASGTVRARDKIREPNVGTRHGKSVV